MATLQRLPCLGTADEAVTFSAWLVPPGGDVRRGQELAEIETLKAAFTIEAEHDGVLLRTLVEPGASLRAAAPLCVIGARGEVVPETELRAAESPAARSNARSQADAAAPAAASHDAPPPGAPAAVPVPAALAAPPAAPPAPVAPAARRRAAELGVPLAAVRGGGPDGLVRASDVERAHRERAPAAAGAVDPEFVALLRADRAGFAALASATKVALYRRAGAQIGADCRLGDGALVIAERLVLGDGASIGEQCTVEARELHAGALLRFGARCRIRCTKLSFGDNAFFADDVEVGGGGALDPEAELAVGSHGFVGEHVHLNPCRPIRIGDEVVISRNANLMTHSFGASVLRGHPARFAGITIGDGAQIGIGVTVFPGVEVGAGAIVVSGSFLATSVPAGRLFGGVPARDLKAATRALTSAQAAAAARDLVVEFARQLRLRGFTVDVADSAVEAAMTVVHEGGRHHLQWRSVGAFGPCDAAAAENVFVTLAGSGSEAPATASTVISLEPPRIAGPLGPLASAFREFLRKRGVRLHPRAWTYRGGWL